MDARDRITEHSEKALWSAQKLYLNLQEAFPGLVADFEAKWQSWQLAISPSSSPSDWSSVTEFDGLWALGPKIIPLVVYKLTLRPDDITSVHLYNRLEKDKEFLVDSSDPKGQGHLILDKNLERNRFVRNTIAAWAEHCDKVSIQSSLGSYTECEEYDQLLDLGGSIIAHIMIEYKKKDGPLFWYELLHEIMWGYKTGQQTVSLDMQYGLWAEWFEKKNHDQAPHYHQQGSQPGT